MERLEAVNQDCWLMVNYIKFSSVDAFAVSVFCHTILYNIFNIDNSQASVRLKNSIIRIVSRSVRRVTRNFDPEQQVKPGKQVTE